MFERRSEHPAPWLEMELARHLGPVAAPDSLWDRVQQPRVRRPAASSRSAALWPVAAGLLLMASGGAVWRLATAHDLPSDMENLAAQELQEMGTGSPALDIRSDDPAEIRTWAKAKADIDLELPASRPARIQLLGARLIQLQKGLVAAVAYRVGDNDTTLLVARKRAAHSGNSAPSKHVFSRVESGGSARLISWNTREQLYTIASSPKQDAHAGCLLCHEEAQGLTTLN